MFTKTEFKSAHPYLFSEILGSARVLNLRILGILGVTSAGALQDPQEGSQTAPIIKHSE